MSPDSRSAPSVRGNPTDAVIGLYLILTAGLVLFHRESLPGYRTYLALHLVGALLVGSLRYLPGKIPAAAAFLRSWYPAILFPVLYKEVEVLAAAFGNWDLTSGVKKIEEWLFGGQPSLLLSEAFPFVPLSELLHFCYLSYVLWFPLVGGYWYFTGERSRFHELLFLLAVTYTASYLFYILFPVDSPFYLEPPLGPPLPGHFFHDLVHFVSSRGGARGGAFPSSHVSVSTVILLTALKYERKWAAFLVPMYLGLVLSTVYGRFHYALDVLAGWALALVIVGWHHLSSRRNLVRRIPNAAR
ncbi:MAG TPA: phosphatase PAP2 family protein [Vicinamibacteria bacterium]|nr:phosphatase PAP2 family protein [Vicinamibacteria bacterium]